MTRWCLQAANRMLDRFHGGNGTATQWRLKMLSGVFVFFAFFGAIANGDIPPHQETVQGLCLKLPSEVFNEFEIDAALNECGLH